MTDTIPAGERPVCPRLGAQFLRPGAAGRAGLLQPPPRHVARHPVRDQEPLSVVEAADVIPGLVIAGHETTANLIGNLIWRLLNHPDELAAVTDDPGLIPAAVEEGLRHDTSVLGMARTTTRDVGIAGTRIPAGPGCSSCTDPATTTSGGSPTPKRSGWTGRERPSISRSAGGSTSAWAPRSPGWRPGSPWNDCSPGSKASGWSIRKRYPNSSLHSTSAACDASRSAGIRSRPAERRVLCVPEVRVPSPQQRACRLPAALSPSPIRHGSQTAEAWLAAGRPAAGLAIAAPGLDRRRRSGSIT